jgi:ADP-heptose:LPS heptosyltransferase
VAEQLLCACLRGETWSRELVRELAARAAQDAAATRALLAILVEGLSDRFEPRLADTYAELFSEVIATVLPEWTVGELLARYNRVRQPRRFEGDAGCVEKVYVLSRVTLGADIAVTSLVLDAARRRFPRAEVCLVGNDKSCGLFDADTRIRPLSLDYGRRGTLRARLALSFGLHALLARPASLVVDPDSRLTQLGLTPVCSADNYYFFESRSYGSGSDASLKDLTRRWLGETFDIPDAQAYIAPSEQAAAGGEPYMAVSLGVGENLAKRIADPFEEELLRALAATGMALWVDTGPGGEEAERVRRAIARCGALAGRVRAFEGSFAAFAGLIARSRLYLGYDSAGQHAAAACGVPLVCVFAGFPCERFLARWRPSGAGPIEIVRVENPDPAAVLADTLRAVGRLLGR